MYVLTVVVSACIFVLFVAAYLYLSVGDYIHYRKNRNSKMGNPFARKAIPIYAILAIVVLAYPFIWLYMKGKKNERF